MLLGANSIPCVIVESHIEQTQFINMQQIKMIPTRHEDKVYIGTYRQIKFLLAN